MHFKILTALALSLSLGTSALAQTATDTDTTADTGMSAAGGLPSEWEGEIGEAFFSDPEHGTLRSEDDVRAAWDELSEDQQTVVQSHCAEVDTTASAPDDAAEGADTAAGMPTDDMDEDDVAADLGTDDTVTDPGASDPSDMAEAPDDDPGVDDEATASIDDNEGADQHASIAQLCEWVDNM